MERKYVCHYTFNKSKFQNKKMNIETEFPVERFLKKYGTDTTNNFQLIRWAKELNIKPFYTTMRDELMELPELPKISIIVNLHTADQAGVHWSAIYTCDYYFDSYGLPPTKEVKNYMKTCLYNTYIIQESNKSYCGQLCLYVLHKLNQGNKFEDIIKELNLWADKS